MSPIGSCDKRHPVMNLSFIVAIIKLDGSLGARSHVRSSSLSYMYRCFVCIYVGVPCVQCLLVLEERVRSPKTGAVVFFCGNSNEDL